jgi:EmrB/QacA subfamily drug resistance transporter
MSGSAAPSTLLRVESTQGRWALLACILGSGIAGIDATVVNLALPALGRGLHADLAALQWTITAYTLTLASFILLGGSLGDRFGRRRVFVIGTIWFAAASLLCGAAPTIGVLIAARALQGVGGALLVPGSLAMIQASFHPDDRYRAIGAWSGLGGVATAIGPFLGGWLIGSFSWRWVFLINVPVAVVVVVVAQRHLPETRDARSDGRIDVTGALLGALGLGGVTYALIEAPGSGAGSPKVLAAAAVGILGLLAFVLVERRERHPMLDLRLFRSQQFSAANVVTFVVYGAFGGAFLLLAVELQVVAGYSPLQAGVSMLPITVLMLLFSSRAGRLSARIGPRLPMSLGPLVCAAGLLLTLRIGPDASYLRDVLPGVALFGAGLALMVAPLTATVLAAVEDRHAGVASGVNNAVARAAGLIAVSALPAVAGLTGDDYADPVALDAGFTRGIVVAAALLVVGAVIAAASIRNVRSVGPTDSYCPVEGPPVQPDPTTTQR